MLGCLSVSWSIVRHELGQFSYSKGNVGSCGGSQVHDLAYESAVGHVLHGSMLTVILRTLIRSENCSRLHRRRHRIAILHLESLENTFRVRLLCEDDGAAAFISSDFAA